MINHYQTWSITEDKKSSENNVYSITPYRMLRHHTQTIITPYKIQKPLERVR